jgi:hypothetical protein
LRITKEELVQAGLIYPDAYLSSAQPEQQSFSCGQENDLISRKAAIDALRMDISIIPFAKAREYVRAAIETIYNRLEELPSAQPTLYGYNVEHLAYIARVMEKEGVTAEYAVRTFDDMGRAIKMIMEEAREKVEEALNEQFNRSPSGD